jgi:hypothetical protein
MAVSGNEFFRIQKKSSLECSPNWLAFKVSLARLVYHW